MHANGRSGFRCPQCLSPAGLQIVARLELGSDADSDEITLQVLECTCAFQGIAVYEESRRGSLESESWNHVGYRLAPGHAEALAARVRSCPRPDDERCECPSHRALGRHDERGRWVGFDRAEAIETFAMVRTG